MPGTAKTLDMVEDGEGDLYPGEIWWRDHQVWLRDQGFTLRDRYQVDWIPSWKKDPRRHWIDVEDGLASLSYNALDAIRQDGKLVVLKRIHLSEEPHELEIGQLFSSDLLANDPNNYCVPLLDVLQVPDQSDIVIIVMPLLYYHDLAPLETIGEGVEAIRQLFEGLHFMHEKHIAHRDVKYMNLMADLNPLFDVPPHPLKTSERRDFKGPIRQRYSRTNRPVKHYFIDFGLSKEYKPENVPHLEPAGWGGDRTVPEFQARDGKMCDPFAVDVYCMGNFIRSHFTQGDEDFPRRLGFEFLNDLVNDMVQDDPAKRPSMKDVVLRYSDIIKELSSWKIRCRVRLATEKRAQKMFREVSHWMKQAKYLAMRVHPIPRA